jgi:hypothetical protein
MRAERCRHGNSRRCSGDCSVGVCCGRWRYVGHRLWCSTRRLAWQSAEGRHRKRGLDCCRASWPCSRRGIGGWQWHRANCWNRRRNGRRWPVNRTGLRVLEGGQEVTQLKLRSQSRAVSQSGWRAGLPRFTCSRQRRRIAAARAWLALTRARTRAATAPPVGQPAASRGRINHQKTNRNPDQQDVHCFAKPLHATSPQMPGCEQASTKQYVLLCAIAEPSGGGLAIRGGRLIRLCQR